MGTSHFKTKTNDQDMGKKGLDLRTRTWLLNPANTSTRLWFIGSKLTCVLATTLSKIWFSWLNSPTIHNRDEFISQVETDVQDYGIITVSNHHSCMDDPLLWGILKWRHILFKRLRFTPTAEEVCFTRSSHIIFFSLGRCVPIVRGHGVYQKGMDYCLEKLAEKQWVHIFAEGKVNTTKENMRFKWGVGRLVLDCGITPRVLPIFHVGIDSILPNKKPYLPLIGKKVTILVGDTLDFTQDVADMKRLNISQKEMRKYITDRIEEEMHVLGEKANILHNVGLLPSEQSPK